MDLTQDDRELFATSAAFAYTRMSSSGFLLFLNEGSISIGAKTQALIQ